jgi:hypothetical protein
MNSINANKKMKWSKNRKRLRDALEGNVYRNQLSKMLENFQLLKPDEFLSCKNDLLKLALKNASKECAIYLIEKEARTSIEWCLLECDYNKIDKVYNLINELSSKYEFNSSGPGGLYNNHLIKKKTLISRLISPVKVSENSDRVDYLFKMICEGFFTSEDVMEQIEISYIDKKEQKSQFISLFRDLKLKQLGI